MRFTCAGSFLIDERGSIVAVSDASGNAVRINAYDGFGIPASTNLGRYQYTGQTWFPELGMVNYKARFYSPSLGRFMQTDPIGYADGMNWYNYVGGDPVNGRDPSGFKQEITDTVGNIYTWNCVGVGNGAGSCGWKLSGFNSLYWPGGGLFNIFGSRARMGMQHQVELIAAEIARIEQMGKRLPQSGLSERVTDILCGIGNVGAGVSGDLYPAGGGGSLSGRITIDPARGRIAIGGTGGVGPGVGGGAGPLITRSTPYSSGAGVLQVGAGACAGGAFVVAATHCETYAGSDGNSGRSTTLSFAKAGGWFNPVAPDIALVTPSLWNIGCKN